MAQAQLNSPSRRLEDSKNWISSFLRMRHPHFQSIFPRCVDNVMKTYLTSLTPSLTEESLQDIPIVLDSQYSQLEISNEPFQSTRVVISSSVGENPVSLMAQEVVPRKRGRPRGSKNKKKPETSRPSCPEVGTQGGGTGLVYCVFCMVPGMSPL